ncbi:hypothetical protein OG806_07055 [Streptomyces sp. NBC_00882]|uniref:hypothetical protein n=1 Tax=Streptomyces sp. NBC_00882 TaxID=2975856 RepID=UPI00386CBD94|nr:hypothetical protein OG806_07055 [Streptomyces sp. NBC_00882]
MSEAQIILSHSLDSGIVAIASGEQYPWAHTALAESGFRRDFAATLSRLADAVTDTETLLDEMVHGGPVPSQERNARAWPAIETWLTDGEIFLRQARVSAPHRRPALPVSASARPLTAARPAHRSH